MLRATILETRSTAPGAPLDTVVLDHDARHRRRIRMTTVHGLEFLLDLEAVVTLRGGDVLVLEDGRRIEVLAAPEPLIEVRAREPGALARLAWHLGNRHLPVQVVGGKLRLRSDAVVNAMLVGLGARTRAIEAPFDPEGGAYAPDTMHGHGHGHAHGHDGGHPHDHEHD